MLDNVKNKYNLDISAIRCTFLGRPVAQSFASLFLFEKVFFEYPFARIIELGTWKGNLSLYFLLYCVSETAEFYTYDTLELNPYFDDRNDVLREMLKFYKCFEKADIFKIKDKIIKNIQKQNRTFLFCDNGNKTLEFKTFVPFLKKADIIGVHDWNKEIHENEIKETIEKYGLEIIFEDFCLKYDNNIRFFKKNK